MRIALLTTSFPEGAGDSAGHFVETEALRMAREGHDVHVVAPGRRGSARTVKRGDAAITVWGAGGGALFGAPGALVRARQQPLRLLELPRFIGSGQRLLHALAPLDQVVAHFLVPCGYPLALRSTGRLEVVLHGSDVRLVARFPRPVRAKIVAALLDRGARFRFVSQELESHLLATLGPRERERLRQVSRVELPPIDVLLPAERSLVPPAEGGSEGRPRWVTCARLIRSKRVDLAIREAARRNVHLTIIGDGPLRAELERLALSLDASATFVGRLSRTETLSIIASSQKLLHLSDTEGAPTVIREARALGVPVLTTPVGDVPRWALSDPGIELFRPA